jgi:hypothetical protein
MGERVNDDPGGRREAAGTHRPPVSLHWPFLSPLISAIMSRRLPGPARGFYFDS